MLLLNWHFVHWDEGELLQFGPILKKYVLGWEAKPSQDELMFINVSQDYQLVDITDQYGFPIGNEPITDRVKLANFVEVLANNDNHKALLIDIRFDLPSADDLNLQLQFDRLDRYVVSNHLTGGLPDVPILDVKTGISDYSHSAGSFFKFGYILQDSLLTSPVVLSEIVDGKEFEMKNGLLYEDEAYYLNTFITDLVVRPFDLFGDIDNYFYDNLGNILFLGDEDIGALTEGRIIIMGDFEKSDLHDTLLGEVPGPLILYNAFRNLQTAANQLTIGYFLFVFISFFLISLYLIIPNDALENAINSTIKSPVVAVFVSDFLSYFLMLMLFVGISYFVFGILLNVLWLTIYFFVIDKLLGFIYRNRHSARLS